MNTDKLLLLEERFLAQYPLGFNDPGLKEIEKRHKVNIMHQLAHDWFNPAMFHEPIEVADHFGKLIAKSSLVSIFEKAKFKDVIKQMTFSEKVALSEAIHDNLFGNQEKGFNQMVEILAMYEMAKWPILTVLGLYYNGDYEVLVKPTTAKNILKYLEVSEFKYTSKPNYQFYNQYRTLINDLKERTQTRLADDNGAFCGFLMMTIE